MLLLTMEVALFGNYYLSFDGVDDYVDISNSHSLNFGESSISYSLWKT